MNDDGSFVIAWESYIPTAGTGTYNIFYQGFTAAGVAQFNGHANDQVDFPGNEVNASIAADGNDNFVIAWDGNGGQVVNGGSPTDLDNAGVFYRQFNAQGQATSGEMRANVTTAGVQQFPSVGMSRDGGLVVAWQGRGTVDRQGIYYRRFPAQYDTVGPAVAEVDTPTDQVIPEKGMVNQSVGYLVVTYDVDVNHQTASQSGYANSALNPANYQLIYNSSDMTGALTPVAYGVGAASAAIPGYPVTDKYELVLQINGKAFNPVVTSLPAGSYQLMVEDTVEDSAANPLNSNLANPAGSSFTRNFTVLVPTNPAAPVGNGALGSNEQEQAIDGLRRQRRLRLRLERVDGPERRIERGRTTGRVCATLPGGLDRGADESASIVLRGHGGAGNQRCVRPGCRGGVRRRGRLCGHLGRGRPDQGQWL